MFQALSRLFGSKPKKAPRISLPLARAEPASYAAAVPAVPIRPMEPPSPEPKPAAPPAPAEPGAKERWKVEATVAPARDVPPEELCGITPGMNSMEIRERISKLYQRHNRAASSLDPKLREEAEFMLETLAGLREKHVGNTLSS